MAMIEVQRFSLPQRARMLIVAAVVVVAALAGMVASTPVLALLLVIAGGLVVLRRQELMLFAILFAALLVPIQINTGTDVALNVTAFLVPATAILWFLSMILSRRISFVPSRLNRPLFVFLIAGLFSLLIGLVLWDPIVPRSSHFVLVMLAQWAIVAFSAIALLLTANLVRSERLLRRLTFVFLLVGGTLALLSIIPGLGAALQLHRLLTVAFIRAPLWVLLAALAGGQLLYNRGLSLPWRFFCLLVIGTSLVYCFLLQRAVVSNWLGVMVALFMLAWLRWKKLRPLAVLLILLLLATGLLLPAVYEFAGGEAEWAESGGSRLALIGRVLDMTWRHNPITGLGPAAYRPYGFVEPLRYGNALWWEPRISSHNNYVDLFAHFGMIGLAIFIWFAVETARLGLNLRARCTTGFAAGYINAMVAAGAGSLVIMLLADWILPFVYNIGFDGFQASVLMWLFMGGLVVLDIRGERGRSYD